MINLIILVISCLPDKNHFPPILPCWQLLRESQTWRISPGPWCRGPSSWFYPWHWPPGRLSPSQTGGCPVGGSPCYGPWPGIRRCPPISREAARQDGGQRQIRLRAEIGRRGPVSAQHETHANQKSRGAPNVSLPSSSTEYTESFNS